ncbi:MAG: DsbA family protein [Desulfobacterales bacterium]|nr:DsbA family protein [Desulfobacterales bacterium]
MKYKIFAGICLLFIGLFAATSFYYKKDQARMYKDMAANDSSTFVRPHSRILGPEDAKVVIVEFMDPACETCAAFSPLIKQIMDRNPDKIKLVIRYAPFHQGADGFVKILEAAGKQDKYWETLNVMFKTQSVWANHHNYQPELLWDFLPKASLDIEQLKKDMEDPTLNDIIAQDMADAKTLNVQKTPGFFVNGKPLEPFGSKQLIRLISSALNEKY